MGHKKPFQFIAQSLNASDCLNLSPVQPWMPPWGSRPPTSPPPRRCCSGTHRCRRWRATSSSSPAMQVRWGSTSAHLHLSPIPKPRARRVPSMGGVGKEPLLWEGSSWRVAGLYPIPRCQLLPGRSHGTCFPLPPTKPQSMAVHTGGDWDPPALLTGPPAAAQGQASTYPTETWCVANSTKPATEGKESIRQIQGLWEK